MMTTMKTGSSTRGSEAGPGRGVSSPAFLLAQVGAHAAARFAEHLSPLGLTPAHAGLLRVIARSAGASQQEVAATLGMYPSRLVALIDELEERHLVERRSNAGDRRTYSLVLTAEGERTLAEIGRVAREHQDVLLSALSREERDMLAALLLRVATQQGLTPGVHPAARAFSLRCRASGTLRI